MIGSGLIVSAVGGLLTAFTRPAALLGLAGSAVLVAGLCGAWWASEQTGARAEMWQTHAQRLERAVVAREQRQRADESLADEQARQIAGMHDELSRLGRQRDGALEELDAERAAKLALERRLAQRPAGARLQTKKGNKADVPAQPKPAPGATADGWTPHSVRVFERARARLRAGKPR